MYVRIWSKYQIGLRVISNGWKDESGMVTEKSNKFVMTEALYQGWRNRRMFPVGAGAASYASFASFFSITLPLKRPSRMLGKEAGNDYYLKPRENLAVRQL